LNERAELASQIAALKEQLALPFYVPSREKEIVERLSARSAGRFPKESLRAVFQEIFSACLALQQPMPIAYLGPESTFTHVAVQRQFGLSARAISCGTISSVFSTV